MSRALMRRYSSALDPDHPANRRDSAQGRLPGSISRAVLEAHPSELQQRLSTRSTSTPLRAPLDLLIKSQVAGDAYKDLAVKYPRIGVFNLNGLRADCKMNCWVLGCFRFERSGRRSRSRHGLH